MKHKSAIFLFAVLFWALPSFAENGYPEKNRDQIIADALDMWESKKTPEPSFDVAASKSSGVFDPYYEEGYSDWADEKAMDPDAGPRYDPPAWDYPDDVGPLKTKHTFDAQFSVARYKYNEDYCYSCEVVEEGTNALKHKGNLFGIHGQYTYRPDRDDVLYTDYLNVYRTDASFKWATDLTEIRPAVNNVRIEDVSDVKNYIFEFRGIVGKEYPKGMFDVLFYSGVGYRHRRDKNKPSLTPNNYMTFRSTSNNFYIPLGFELSAEYSRDWDYKLTGEYDLNFYGKTKHYYSDYNDYFPALPTDDVSFKQKHGFGLKGALEFIKKTSSMDLVFGPYFEYWKMDLSDSVRFTGFGVPAETNLGQPYTVESGLKLGLKY